MCAADDPEFQALQQLTRNFRSMADVLASQGEAPRNLIDNALVTAGLAEMVKHVGAQNVADWLRKQADAIEALGESAPLMRLQ